MKALRRRVSVLFLMTMLVIVSAAFASEYLLDFYGYDYWYPLSPPINTPGNCYNSVGFVPDANSAYLSLNHGTNEYTFHIDGACLVSSTTVGSYIIYDFVGGTFDVYCDLRAGGTAATYGTNPPNATAPPTFIDGDRLLGGDFTGFQIVRDTSTGNADLYGTLDLIRGSQLGSIPVEQRGGWTLAGLRASAPGAPAGYYWQIDGQLFIEPPTAVEGTSWGGLKRHFGEGN